MRWVLCRREGKGSGECGGCFAVVQDVSLLLMGVSGGALSASQC
jgi:hypothetical protein